MTNQSDNELRERVDRLLFQALDLALSLFNRDELASVLHCNGIHVTNDSRASMMVRVLQLKFGGEMMRELYSDRRTFSEKIAPPVHLLDLPEPCKPLQAVCGVVLHPFSAHDPNPVTVSNSANNVTCPACRRLIEMDISDRT